MIKIPINYIKNKNKMFWLKISYKINSMNVAKALN